MFVQWSEDGWNPIRMLLILVYDDQKTLNFIFQENDKAEYTWSYESWTSDSIQMIYFFC